MGLKSKLAAAFLASSAVVGTIMDESASAYNRGAASADALIIQSNTIRGFKGEEAGVMGRALDGAASVLLGFAGGASESFLDENNQIELKTLPLIVNNAVFGVIGGISANFNSASDGISNADLAAELKNKVATEPEYASGNDRIHKFAMEKSYSHHMPSL